MWPRVVVALTMLQLASPAAAQTFKSAEISGGYAFLNDPKTETEFKAGWMIGAAVSLTDWLSAVAEAGGNYATVAGFASDTHLAIHGVMAGGRASAKLGRLIEFGQIVGGVTRVNGSRFGLTETNTAGVVQPGVGLDFPLRPTLAVRAQLDVRFIGSRAGGNEPGHHVRFVAAVAYQRKRR